MGLKRPVNKSQRSDFSSEAVFNPGPGFKLKVLFRLLQPTRLINIKSMAFQLIVFLLSAPPSIAHRLGLLGSGSLDPFWAVRLSASLRP
jgi:hypothetical protein